MVVDLVCAASADPATHMMRQWDTGKRRGDCKEVVVVVDPGLTIGLSANHFEHSNDSVEHQDGVSLAWVLSSGFEGPRQCSYPVELTVTSLP
jgi:hypothetical protein